LLTREFRERADAKAPERLVADMFATGEVDGAVHAAMLADLKLYLPGDLLTLADRISMQHSLEVRVPFLDHPLVELMARVPRRLKLSGWTKKVLMRKAFDGLLPASILNRRKLGFSVPLALWLRTDLKDTMREILGEAEIRRLGYLQHSEVERIMQEHLSGRVNHENRLWALMNLVSWHRRWGTRGRV
jgi:asparagine synthase (glutamine-hydrolysing)